MVLIAKQEEGLRTAVARHRAGEKYTVSIEDLREEEVDLDLN